MINIKSTQLSNLIVYFLLMLSDDNYKSTLSYTCEKFDRIFINRNIKIDLETEYDITNRNLKLDIEYYNIKWKYDINDKDFLVIYFTQKIIYEYFNIKNKSYNGIEMQKSIIEMLLKTYKCIFKDCNSIINEDMSYLLHPILKNILHKYIENNARIFKLLKLNE